jgi:Spy/CpxP family protein refolding chaperone
MRKKFAFGAALAGALLMAGAAIAQPHGEWGHGPFEFLHGLNLSEAQQAQVHQIMKSAWANEKPIMEKLRAAHQAEITALLAAGNVTADSVAPTLAQEDSLRQQLDQAHVATALQIRAVLTPEQLAAAASKYAQIEQLHEQEHALMGAPQP